MRPITLSTGLLLVGLLSACSPPEYGDSPFLCGPSNECPSGYACSNKVCVRNGITPPSMTGTDPNTTPTYTGNYNYEAGNQGSQTAVPPSNYMGGGSSGAPPATNPPGSPGGTGFGQPEGGPWGTPCYFHTDCPDNQRCGFFAGRCCDPLANPSCV